MASDELAKVPNIYAQIAGATLRVLDALLVSSDVVASYMKQNNSTGSEDVTDKRVFNYNGSTIFTAGTLK